MKRKTGLTARVRRLNLQAQKVDRKLGEDRMASLQAAAASNRWLVHSY